MGARIMSKRLCILQVTPEKPNPEHIEYFKDNDFPSSMKLESDF